MRPGLSNIDRMVIPELPDPEIRASSRLNGTSPRFGTTDFHPCSPRTHCLPAETILRFKGGDLVERLRRLQSQCLIPGGIRIGNVIARFRGE